MKILVTCNHQLSKAQLDELNSFDISYLKDLSKGLFEKLSSLSGEENLSLLSYDLHNLIIKNNFDAVMLPIGSPAFMFAFACNFQASREQFNSYEVYFSHSQREVKETVLTNGEVEKISLFSHKHFITF